MIRDWLREQFSTLSIHKSLGPDRMHPQERQGHTGDSPTKSHKAQKGTGTCLIRGKAESAGTVLPGEEKAQGDLIKVYKYLKGKCKEDRDRIFFSGAQVMGPEATGTN